jgi:hypothetical protein
MVGLFCTYEKRFKLCGSAVVEEEGNGSTEVNLP